MKKIILIFAGILLVTPVVADNEPGATQQSLDLTTNVVTTSYVRGAYNTLDSAKQEKLTSIGSGANITDSGTGPYVGGVTATNGRVTITKSEVTIPVGNPQLTTSESRAAIWVE